MSRSINLRSKIVVEEIKKHPNASNNELAKFIYEKHKDIFTNKEHVRSLIRGKKGALGKRNRNVLSKELFTNTAKEILLAEMQEGIDESLPPFVFPETLNNTLVISDLHIPYHVLSSIRKALEYGKLEKVDSILINGDLMEMRAVSPHNPHIKERVGLKVELEETRNFLIGLRKAFDVPIYFKKANHENFYEKRYLPNKALELLGIDEFKLDILLKLGELHIIPIEDQRIIKYGKLNVIHGHEIRTGMMAPVNPARGLYLRAKVSTLEGHVHRTSEHTETDINGNTVTCWSTGCLSQLRPEYAGIASSYNLGFAHLLKESNGEYQVNNLRIINDKIR